MTKLARMLQRIWGNHHEVTEDDIHDAFGDYHNVLHWLATFLVEDDQLADACVIDACRVAQTESPVFHEWLVRWAARATFRSAFLARRERISELASRYEQETLVDQESQPLSVEQLRLLIDNSEELQSRLDVLCRFVLVLRGIAKEPADEIANQLGITPDVVERAYLVAFHALEIAPHGDLGATAAHQVDHELAHVFPMNL